MQVRQGHFGAFRSRSICITLATIAATLAAVACEQSPLAPASLSHKPDADKQPFYYYQGERIALVRDPTRLIIAGSTAAGRSAQQRLMTARIVASSEALPGSETHSVLRLAPGLTEAALTEARRAALRTGQISFAAFAYKVANTGVDFILLDRLIVKFKNGVTRFQIDSLNHALGTTVEREPKLDSGFAQYWLKYPVDSLSDPLDIAARLSRSSIVEYSSADHQVTGKKLYVPTDPFYSLQYYLHNTSVLNGVTVDDNLQPAWDLTLGSHSITVSVIDDGVQGSHPELAAAVAGSTGFDALYNSPGVPGSGEWAFAPCTVCLGSDTFADGHGTSIAGEIAAAHNGQGISGIAPNVRLESARMIRNDMFADESGIVNAISWSGQHSDILNLSWHVSPQSDAIDGAIRGAASGGRDGRGSLVVIAAGNDGGSSLNYPASLAGSSFGIVAVGAIDRFGVHSYSNTGAGLTLVAVTSGANSNDLTTIDLLGSPGYNFGPAASPSDYTSRFGGTSAAAPQVAAVAALLLSREPNLTALQVRDRLIQGAKPWGSATTFGAGKLDAYATLLGVSQVVTGPTSFTLTCNPFGCTPQTLTYSSTASGGNGTFSYQWKTRTCGQNAVVRGTASTQSISVSTHGDFYVQSTVTSGGRSIVTNVFVDDPIWTPGPGIFCTTP
jgi:subtilisin family serine protease